MKRRARLFAALLLLAAGHAAAGETMPALTVGELPPPTTSSAIGAAITLAPSGTAWLSWLEPIGSDAHVFRFATLDAAVKEWSSPGTITKGSGFFTWYYLAADYPSLTAGENGCATAVCYSRNAAHAIQHRATISRTQDGGNTWSAPRDLAATSDSESVALATLADGRVLAAWLDGRADKTDRGQQLFARVLGESGPDILIDQAVADFSPIALTAFPDGGALLAYHGRSDDNRVTVRTAGFTGHSWEDSKPLDNDVGRATGPRLASDGGRVAAAWFTSADNAPRVLASFSPDAGARFLMPLRVDQGKPIGHVDTLVLHDGALLVTWLESDGSVWLRRVTPEFTTGQLVRLAAADAASGKIYPRLALLRDYAGGKTSAQAMVVFASEIAVPLRVLLVTVPEGELLNAEKNCDCAPTPEQLQGFPLRGTISAIDPDRGLLRVQHEPVPGVLAAGLHEFRAAPDVIAAVQSGRHFLGRIERRNGAWQLFDVRLFTVASP